MSDSKDSDKDNEAAVPPASVADQADEARQAPDSSTTPNADDPVPVARQDAGPARRSGSSGALALLLALLAITAGGYAAWRVVLLERGEHNASTTEGQRLDAIDVRIAEIERRTARSNELATTLREQLAENERLQTRMREDVLALSDRNARSEALLAEMARGQRSSGQQLALADAGILLGQADARLRLFGDRAGAAAALALAEQNLARAGHDRADLRNAIADARTALSDDPRPSTAALLGELDAVAQALTGLAVNIERPGGDLPVEGQGWWARQFGRLDRLVTIRREDEAVAGTIPSKDGVRLALNRARLAALEHDHAALPDALRSARASLQTCCDPVPAQSLLARIESLLAIDWDAPLPDLGALRDRLDARTGIDRDGDGDSGSAPATDADTDANAENDAPTPASAAPPQTEDRIP